jgi:hypothetical protein
MNSIKCLDSNRNVAARRRFDAELIAIERDDLGDSVAKDIGEDLALRSRPECYVAGLPAEA